MKVIFFLSYFSLCNNLLQQERFLWQEGWGFSHGIRASQSLIQEVLPWKSYLFFFLSLNPKAIGHLQILFWEK